jgi:hypothetical protein
MMCILQVDWVDWVVVFRLLLKCHLEQRCIYMWVVPMVIMVEDMEVRFDLLLVVAAAGGRLMSELQLVTLAPVWWLEVVEGVLVN